MRRFFCSEVGDAGTAAVLDPREASHLFKTLRAKPGERIELLDGEGVVAAAEIADDKVLTILSRRLIPRPHPAIKLFTASPRRHIFDSMLKQCAELGVVSITPLATERSVAEPRNPKTLERWRILLIDGCKQSGNPYLPEITPLTDLREAVSRIDGAAFFGSPRGEDNEIATKSANIAWFVGPEGGFADSEERMMLDAGFNPLRLGQWTLRVETAAVAGIAVLQAGYHD